MAEVRFTVDAVSQALCRISRQTPGVFQNVVDKVGAPKIRAALAQPVTRVQQAIITMILGLVTSDVRHTHFLLDKVTVMSLKNIVHCV